MGKTTRLQILWLHQEILDKWMFLTVVIVIIITEVTKIKNAYTILINRNLNNFIKAFFRERSARLKTWLGKGSRGKSFSSSSFTMASSRKSFSLIACSILDEIKGTHYLHSLLDCRDYVIYVVIHVHGHREVIFTYLPGQCTSIW